VDDKTKLMKRSVGQEQPSIDPQENAGLKSITDNPRTVRKNTVNQATVSADESAL
jgi:hypothetical protein